MVYKLKELPDGTINETRLGRTEVVKDSLDPAFVEEVECDFHIEAVTNKFRVKVFHAESEEEKALDDEQKHQYIGQTDF